MTYWKEYPAATRPWTVTSLDFKVSEAARINT